MKYNLDLTWTATYGTMVTIVPAEFRDEPPEDDDDATRAKENGWTEH